MNYYPPSIRSSFELNNIGESLYRKIVELNPSRVLELGVLHGYSSHIFFQSLAFLGGPRTLISIDLFDDYLYNKCDLKTYSSNLVDIKVNSPNVSHHVKKMDILKNINALEQEFADADLVFIDISNDGKNLLTILERCKCPVLFEGGSAERDQVPWMIKYQRPPISSIKNCGYNYSLVDSRYPSLSFCDVQATDHCSGV
jgi:hypothetical protein